MARGPFETPRLGQSAPLPRLVQAALAASSTLLLIVLALHVSRIDYRRRLIEAETNITAAFDKEIAQRFERADDMVCTWPLAEHSGLVHSQG